MTTWQVQAAKQRFSELVRAAEAGEPQFITRHGQAVAVMIDVAEYRAAYGDRPRSFKELLASVPDIGDLELPPRVDESVRRLGGVLD